MAEVGDGRGVVTLPDDDRLHNHVGSQHAGALFSAGEAASGAAFMGAFAEHLGNITPLARSADISYLKLAKGPITATGTLGEGQGRAAVDGSTRTGRSSSRSMVELTDAEGDEGRRDDRQLARAQERLSDALAGDGRAFAALAAEAREHAAPALLRERLVHRAHAVEDLLRDLLRLLAASDSSTCSKVTGSPYWTVTFGSTPRLASRTCSEPWIATGTTGTPDSSASRPRPGFGLPELLGARAAALARTSARCRPGRGSSAR